MGKKLLTVVIVALLLTGCSDDSKEKFTIMTQQIQLIVGESQKIEASGSFTARSTDEQVATVAADGTITALAEGDADIIFTSTEDASQKQACHVRAEWRYHYFEEPILDFTMNLEQIKERETHEYFADNFWDNSGEPSEGKATDPWLIRYRYTNQPIPLDVCYALLDKNNGGLGEIVLTPGKNGWRKDDIILQLSERYGSPSSSNGDYHFTSTLSQYSILLGGGAVIYRPKNSI